MWLLGGYPIRSSLSILFDCSTNLMMWSSLPISKSTIDAKRYDWGARSLIIIRRWDFGWLWRLSQVWYQVSPFPLFHKNIQIIQYDIISKHFRKYQYLYYTMGISRFFLHTFQNTSIERNTFERNISDHKVRKLPMNIRRSLVSIQIYFIYLNTKITCK